MAEPGTKRCTKCGDVKPLDAFARRGPGRRQSWCRECKRSWDRSTYRVDTERRTALARSRQAAKARNLRLNRALLIEHFRSHPCVDCGETDIRVLEFDHVRDTKDREVSRLLELSPGRVRSEIAKCEVRCGNCHRRKTAIERNWWIHREVLRLQLEGRLST